MFHASRITFHVREYSISVGLAQAWYLFRGDACFCRAGPEGTPPPRPRLFDRCAVHFCGALRPRAPDYSIGVLYTFAGRFAPAPPIIRSVCCTLLRGASPPRPRLG